MGTIETARADLPAPAELYEICITLAVLDTLTGTRFPKFRMGINSGDPSRWFLLDDGAGNNLSILFSDSGVFLRGFDHESCMSPHADGRGFKIYPGLFTGFPSALLKYLENPELLGDADAECFPAAFDDGATRKVPSSTFSAWWDAASRTWQYGKIEFPEFKRRDSDGASFLIGSIDTARFCEEYDWEETLVPAVEARKPLTAELLAQSAKADPVKVHAYLSEIGYGQRCPLNL